MRFESMVSRNVLRTGAAAIACVALASAAPRAFAGDAVKLSVEFMREVSQLQAGETLDVQIVGIDATGARVGVKDIEFSSTVGRFELVQAPYKFRYTAPSDLAQPAKARLRAWVRTNPEVQGEASIECLPPAPYKTIRLTGPGTLPGGIFVDLDLSGVTAGGSAEPVKSDVVKVSVESGPGSLTLVKPGRYRFEAPADAQGTAKIVAQLLHYPSVRSTLDILITSGAGSIPTPPAGGGGLSGGSSSGGSSSGGAPSGGNSAGGSSGGSSGGSTGGSSGGTVTVPPVVPPVPPASGGSGGASGVSGGGSDKPTGGATGGTKPTGDDAGVMWTNGAVRVATWRTRAATETEFTADGKDLPKAGSEFVATKERQKLRIVVERAGVTKVDVEEWIGEKKGADVKRLEDKKDGPFQLERNKKGNFVVHYECSPPENGKPVMMAILLSTSDGKVIREEFAFRRETKK